MVRGCAGYSQVIKSVILEIKNNEGMGGVVVF
jgi:hypothetical protein